MKQSFLYDSFFNWEKSVISLRPVSKHVYTMTDLSLFDLDK
jgi:hypothetical protein